MGSTFGVFHRAIGPQPLFGVWVHGVLLDLHGSLIP